MGWVQFRVLQFSVLGDGDGQKEIKSVGLTKMTKMHQRRSMDSYTNTVNS